MTDFPTFFHQSERDVMKQRTAIKTLLSGGPASVSDIAEKLALSKKLIVWNLLAMLKWGSVEVIEERDEELVYALKEV